MGDVLDAPVHVDRPGSATVQRSAMLKVSGSAVQRIHFTLKKRKIYGLT